MYPYNTCLFRCYLNILRQKSYNIFLIQIRITILINNSKSILQSQLRIMIPLFYFVQNVLSPIKFLISFYFWCIFSVYKCKECFIINHWNIFHVVHRVEHILFLCLCERDDLIEIVMPLFSCNKTVIMLVNSSKHIHVTNFLFYNFLI